MGHRFNFVRKKLFSIAAVHFKFPQAAHKGSKLFVSLQYLLFSVGVGWLTVAILLCVSCLADVEHFFIHMPFLEKCLFKVFVQLSVGFFAFLLLSCSSLSYILNNNCLPDI